MDAKAKADRNAQWDDAFAQLREALDRPEATTTASPGHAGSMATEFDSLADSDAAQHADQHRWDNLRLDSRLPGAQALAWPANTGRKLKPHHLPPQSLWAPDELRWTAIRKRQTRKKLAMQELATSFLVFQLISHVNLAQSLKSAQSVFDQLVPPIRQMTMTTGAASETARTAFLMDLESLHRTHVSSTPEQIASARKHVEPSWIPSYHQDVDGDYYEICKQMNDSITRLLRQCGRGIIQEKGLVIAKICHNLLVSTAAPDLHTFNILLTGFSLWRRHQLVDDVIAAFRTSKIRPNELLCTQILDHYTDRARADAFTTFVTKMRGIGNALMLANPDINITEAGQDRLVKISEDKVLQKIHPTPMVFAALIKGVLKFAGFDRALEVYYDMKADGWGLAMPTLTKLLADCIRRADWEGGTYVWEEINSIKASVKPSHMTKAYHHMLSLCSVTGNTVAFNQVLNEVAKRGFHQKSIITAAMETTRWAQHGGNARAPAWATDNLMIAVSGYIKDGKSHSREAEEVPLEEMEFDDRLCESTDVDGKADVPGLPSSSTIDSLDEKEAWSSWVEHELSERPKDPEL
ncbi:hypothetical protein ACEQ8H_006904 [Pleosporales sp. CAS-2024a]